MPSTRYWRKPDGYQEWGLGYREPRSKKHLLDYDKIWRIPDGLKLPPYAPPDFPLLDSERLALNSYRADKRNRKSPS
jgi:hypothetical protein